LVVALIVTVSVWLIAPQNDVDSLLQRLGRPGNDRWLAAMNLAAVLHEPGNEQLKRDPALAKRLADLLRKEIETGQDDGDSINLRVFLCRVLGEFHIAEPLPVLVEAARPRETAGATRVRCAAIEAAAVLASHVGPDELQANDALLDCLCNAAGDRQHTVRQSAAFTLGVVGGDRAQTVLVTMLADEHPEVRYNAATGLARHGNIAAADVLCEMLDPKRAASGDARERLIPLNALRAVEKLAAANPRADLEPLRQAVAKLSNVESGVEIRVKATDVLRQLKRQ
ncbi:MAG: HEAT repeat domain-containing protein, partial [Candidatus Nealsonbacteria bacterium]|nr:HEAT repeat domain-containing protein [Candidatus Nealsonbacteria bacterium]